MTKPICKECNERPCLSNGILNGKRIYKPRCIVCNRLRFRKPYLQFRKNVCEACGFIPKHIQQLDVHHIDHNRKNNQESNLRTLCANCHRLEHIT